MEARFTRKQGSYLHIYTFCTLLLIVAFALDHPAKIWSGFISILFSPSNLITDYIQIGGLGAVFFNSGIIGLITALILRLNRVPLNGAAIAGIITICGFAFFGKNLYNSIPITLGVFFYSLIKKIPFKDVAVTSMFATSLGPLISMLSFGFSLNIWQGVIAGYSAGILIGLIITPLANSFINFHQGFNLYNIGFTAGIIGMFATGILRMFDLQIDTTLILSSGNNLLLNALLLSLFVMILFLGLYYNKWSFANYRKLTRFSGRLRTDFIESCGYGTTLINMSIMGFVSWSYTTLIGGQLNGATIGAIFTVMGFSAFGNHPLNTLSVFLGAFCASMLNTHQPSSTEAIIATLFGSTLAPIAGRFGVFAGIFAGFAHVSMATNISYLHGGMNLYNNGFSGGFVAATLAPIYTTIEETIKAHKTRNVG